MTTVDDLDRLLEDVLLDDGPSAAPAHVLSFALDGVADRGQRHPIVAWLDREAWPRTGPVAGTGRPVRSMVYIGLALLLALALVAAAVLIGSRMPIPNPFGVIAPEPSDTAPPAEPLAASSGPTLVFGGQAGGLFVADQDGAHQRLLVRGGGYIEPRLSLDRRWIAADAFGTLGRSLAVLRADGSVALDLRGESPVVTYSWGAVGASVDWLAASIDRSLVVVDLISGTRVTIDTGDTMVGALAWSPDVPVLWWATSRPGGLHDGITAADIHSVRIGLTDGRLQIADERSFVLELDPARTVRDLEQMAVSPDGATLAFRARTEGWLRSDLVLADADGGGAARFLTPAPPDAPWVTAWSAVRWLPDGSGVVAEVGDRPEDATVRPTILALDGSLPRPITDSSLKVENGGVVDGTGPVLPSDTAVLVGGAGTWFDTAGGGQVRVHDLWAADADGRGSRRVATDTLGGDLR